MPRMKIGVIDLTTKAHTRKLYGRLMNANLASIMSQVVALWCEQEGHEVTFDCYTGRENLIDDLPEDVDLVFIGAFTQSAQLAYALSNLLRSKGAVTAIGGPHARSYPQDAQKYFDYVLGLTDRDLIRDILRDCSEHRPLGVYLTAKQQPKEFPGIRARWKFIEQVLEKAPLIKVVPAISSFGCPYACSFCIDASIPFQQLNLDVLKEDLRFLRQKLRRPIVGWHDPNFGVRSDEILDSIEEAVPPGSFRFISETSLALLSEDKLKRLKRNGFKAVLPGVESWYDMGNKSRAAKDTGFEKVKKVADQVNLVLEYIPYVQVNFIIGLDSDQGPEPFELTKQFLDLSPGFFPGYSLLLAFGQSSPYNLKYQKENRIIPFPFHFMNNSHVMNVRPKNYTWTEFYDYLIDVTKYSFSWPAIMKRHRAVNSFLPRWMNMVRAISSEGFGRIKYYTELRRRLDVDPQIRSFFEGESTEIPQFFTDMIRKDLGPFWDWLPEGALNHDPDVFRQSERMAVPKPTTQLTEITAEARVHIKE